MWTCVVLTCKFVAYLNITDHKCRCVTYLYVHVIHFCMYLYMCSKPVHTVLMYTIIMYMCNKLECTLCYMCNTAVCTCACVTHLYMGSTTVCTYTCVTHLYICNATVCTCMFVTYLYMYSILVLIFTCVTHLYMCNTAACCCTFAAHMYMWITPIFTCTHLYDSEWEYQTVPVYVLVWFVHHSLVIFLWH